MTIGKPLPEGEDRSYVPKFPVQSLVSINGRVGMVENSQNVPIGGGQYLMLYAIRYGLYRGRSVVIPGAPEESLRSLTWKQFLWHRSPTKGWLMMGRNPALAFIASFIIAQAVCLGSIGWGWWGAVVSLVVTSAWTLFLFGTWMNYTKKWL